MAKTILVIGGSRSGKSDYAQVLAETEPGLRYYLATCPRPTSARAEQSPWPTPGGIPFNAPLRGAEQNLQSDDPEMSARILAHQRKRPAHLWQTVEEPLRLAGLLQTLPAEATILIDCLTLWISNLLYADLAGGLDDEQLTALTQELLAAARPRQGPVIMVSSEVGCGLVPEHALSRRYRDLVGRCNQVMAAGSDRVVHVVCGIPVTIKG